MFLRKNYFNFNKECLFRLSLVSFFICIVTLFSFFEIKIDGSDLFIPITFFDKFFYLLILDFISFKNSILVVIFCPLFHILLDYHGLFSIIFQIIANILFLLIFKLLRSFIINTFSFLIVFCLLIFLNSFISFIFNALIFLLYGAISLSEGGFLVLLFFSLGLNFCFYFVIFVLYFLVNKKIRFIKNY